MISTRRLCKDRRVLLSSVGVSHNNPTHKKNAKVGSVVGIGGVVIRLYIQSVRVNYGRECGNELDEQAVVYIPLPNLKAVSQWSSLGLKVDNTHRLNLCFVPHFLTSKELRITQQRLHCGRLQSRVLRGSSPSRQHRVVPWKSICSFASSDILPAIPDADATFALSHWC